MQYKLFASSLNDKNNVIETVLLNRGIENPHEYYVDLSQKLWDLRRQMLLEKR